MTRSRLIGFIIVVVMGITAGLVYGWVINPAGVKNTTLESLRADYKTDYVLMVAEKFAVDRDPGEAILFLQSLSPAEPLKAVQQALISGQELGYESKDMQLLANLEMGLTLPVNPTVTP
jgi:hypothetical protein